MTSEAARDRQVARETVRPRSECPSCNPPGKPADLTSVSDREQMAAWRIQNGIS